MIREALKAFLKNGVNKPKVVVDELGVINGRAIADVVAIYEFSHCFEIKSDLDSLSRLKNQIESYNACFQKITVVTTDKHVDKIVDIIPEWWGVMIAREIGGRVAIKRVKRSLCNKDIRVESMFYTLWREELADIYSLEFLRSAPRRYSRERLVESVRGMSKKNAINYFNGCILKRNYKKSFTM
tara:strand:+ start:2405 stop:2956 length:552 start_codon:yes stop_codon:yes gene_type:complete